MFCQDIRYFPEGSTHFFGNVILDEQNEPYEMEDGIQFKRYHVVDGQQRLTTVMLFLHAAGELNETVARQLDLVDTIRLPGGRPRLLPQDQNKQFFRDHLLGDAELSPETPSQRRLKNALDEFREYLSELEGEATPKEMARRLRQDFQINIVETKGESEAAAIFESLNDRGKPLSSLEKTKSLLVTMDARANPSGGAEQKIDDRFGDVYRKLFVLSNGHDQAADFDEDAFQRFHWGIYDGYDSNEFFDSFGTLKQRLYETYRSGAYEDLRDEVDEYTLRLREAADAFEKVLRPTGRPDSVEQSLTKLLELGRVANVLPVLMAAQLQYGDDDPDRMRAIVEACETLAFRVYSIDRRRSNTGRSRLVSLAHSIRHDDSYSFQDALDRLFQITQHYADDDRFERDLRDEEFYETIASRDIRYLLYHYGKDVDATVSEDSSPPLSEILSSKFQVEHVLAQSRNATDLPDDIDVFEKHVHRLGNLTVANKYWNQTYSDLPFEQKRQPDPESGREEGYSTSNLRVQWTLSKQERFGAAEIDARENEIVDFALEHWNVE